MIVTLNDVSVDYKDGIVIHEKLSEDLDSGFLTVVNSSAISVEPMDEVVITSGSYTKNMMVSDIKRKTKRYGSKYNYELGLVSPTIQLQRIVLPNRSITQPLSGNKTTIYAVLSNYLDIYAPDFTISSALQTLTLVDCPEFQWNRPTLYEVFNDLLSYVDAVVTMTSFTEISYLDLNTSGSQLDANWNDVEETQNITEYANTIECEAENAVIGYRNTLVTEYLGAKTDKEAIATVDNANILLTAPIYKLNSIKARIPCVEGSNDVYEADLTDYVVEKRVYDQLKTSNSTGSVSGDYKRNRLYFEEGSNKIEGLSYREATWGLTDSIRAITNVFIRAYYEQNSVVLDVFDTQMFNMAFTVEYQSLETVKFLSNKENPTKTVSTLINNQDTSYVDFEAFARKQQQTVNRLGNKVRTYTGKRTLTDMPSLGDYEDDFIIAEREIVLYEDFVNFKGIASEYFVMKNLFTGLKTERRFTSLATENESLECNHITEHTFNLSKIDNTQDSTFENYMLQTGKTDNMIKVVAYTTNETTNTYGIAPSTYYTDKSLILMWRMYDNYSVGNRVDTNDYYTNAYGITYAPYTDEDGKFGYFSYKLYKGYDIPYIGNSTNTYDTDWDDGMEYVRDLPKLTTTLLSGLVYTSGAISRSKDNREITVETIQYNFTSDNNIGYGAKFLQNNPMTYTGTSDETIKVAYSYSETYDKGDQTYKGTIVDAAYLTYTVTNNGITISSPDSSITIANLASWALVDASGNIYVWNNGNNDTIYLNKED